LNKCGNVHDTTLKETYKNTSIKICVYEKYVIFIGWFLIYLLSYIFCVNTYFLKMFSIKHTHNKLRKDYKMFSTVTYYQCRCTSFSKLHEDLRMPLFHPFRQLKRAREQ
jgi:hypothetical protein